MSDVLQHYSVFDLEFQVASDTSQFNLLAGKVAVCAVEQNRSVLACDGREDCVGFAFKELLERKASFSEANDK